MTINQAFTILANAGGIRAARVITENTAKLSYLRVMRMAWQLRRGVPVAKIIHQKWFYGLKFYTNKYTLDPRPDTETLVAAVINDCGAGCAPHILDMGTGTGCIIASLVKNINGATGIGIDISRRALHVARRNIKTLELQNRVQLAHGKFDSQKITGAPFDIIVSNPPYIAYGDNRVDAGAMHDPARALYADDNGLAGYVQIAQNAHKHLKSSGRIYLEIGAGQGAVVRGIFERAGWQFVRSENDLANIERVLVFEHIYQK